MNKLADNIHIFERAGFRVAPYTVVYRSKPAFEAGDDLGYPVVLKVGLDIHKKDIGGVIANIHNGLDMCEAWRVLKRNLDNAGIREEEFIVQKQISGVELIVGMKEDKTFGPVIMLGSGGSFAEVLKDVVFRACPISLKDAEDMIREIKAYELLKGVRGDKPANIVELREMLFSLSRLYMKMNFKEVDLNPVIINSEGAFIADARIITE